MIELIIIRDKWYWHDCYMCEYRKPTKKYKSDKLEVELCDECVGKIRKLSMIKMSDI